MRDSFEKDFGITIAFLLPGFLFLWGISFSSTQVSSWFASPAQNDSQTVAEFLFASLGSLAIGLLISAVRWLLVDQLLKVLGVADRRMNFKNLSDPEKRAAFLLVVENHYRYYQYYSNTLVAVFAAFVFYLFNGPARPPCWVWIGIICLGIALFLGSRDSLSKYYSRGYDALS